MISFACPSPFCLSFCLFDIHLTWCNPSKGFLDHVLRETPSRKFIAIKRSFFSEKNPKASVGGGVFAYKGIYQAIRVVNVRCFQPISIDIWLINSLAWSTGLERRCF